MKAFIQGATRRGGPTPNVEAGRIEHSVSASVYDSIIVYR